MLSLKSFVFVCAAFYAEAAKKYCDITCGSNKHTMCQYSEMDDSCIEFYKFKLEKTNVLNMHNNLRSNTAMGKLGLPKASNMKKMYWDYELEKIALRWAKQCTFGHDSCRTLLSKEAVGQNINFWILKQYYEPTNKFEDWENEAKAVNAALIDSYGPTYRTAGNFTQMIWADSDRVGCALTHFSKNMVPAFLLVCNYATAGNLPGKPVYRKGQPCANCKCSRDFEGLCAREGDNESPFGGFGSFAFAGGAFIHVATQLIVLPIMLPTMLLC